MGPYALFIGTMIDDLEWPSPWTAISSNLGEFRVISRILEGKKGTRMKIDPYCYRRNCSP